MHDSPPIALNNKARDLEKSLHAVLIYYNLFDYSPVIMIMDACWLFYCLRFFSET